MLRKKTCIAMLLAGGQGSRLGILTKNVAKPAVPYGGKYRIIDFPLSNCTNSGIDTVGVLTQYQPLELNAYIGSGAPWDLDISNGGVFVLPPYQKGKSGEWYRGTANAIYQNMAFIEQYHPDYVLILSGDHIYKMDYNAMLDYHISHGADATIAVREVPWEEASRFGIMNTDPDGTIVEFEEKPQNPKSNKASMGVYIFTWEKLRHYLTEDEADKNSSNDFGKNIIPNMLRDKQVLVAYDFNGYWKDVGTIESLWEANMDLIDNPMPMNMHDKKWRIYSKNPGMPPHYISEGAVVTDTLITEGCEVYGKVNHSVLFAGVVVEEGADIEYSVVMPGSIIKRGAIVRRSIVAENATVGAGSIIGEDSGNIAVIGQGVTLPAGVSVPSGTQVDESYTF
ncbi:glucose-1-phosphate adenylyltransferase [Aristaeella hokkaidonensis]|uniref:Glucose-1-phosphate adenylyltransferase n=1 Tax=Aristaeella hokkaidonensis TaxID=3046382 RepID=A0AC61MY36_9FIRM|nr:glucose-1-phosphate adenylyltransferase [Aristaeella hokkaidonensis]QUC67970.1 glucose-1-phosphate adenylyltransferase [Aristaeella hokkaidonensis]SNT93040.1 glucose-1-phosphate adenylyltransferase [Aristaeella hokkaidonensis]